MLIREHQSTAEVRKANNLKYYTPTSASYRSIFIIYSLVLLLFTFIETQIRSLKMAQSFILHPRVITKEGREGGSRARRLSLVSMYCKLFFLV
jgi:hypothetical protein